MTDGKESLIAYLATLAAIVVLVLAAAIICMQFDGSDAQLAKIIAALAFIGAAMTGLIGVIGTFRPKGPPTATTESGNVNLAGTPSKGET